MAPTNDARRRRRLRVLVRVGALAAALLAAPGCGADHTRPLGTPAATSTRASDAAVEELAMLEVENSFAVEITLAIAGQEYAVAPGRRTLHLAPGTYSYTVTVAGFRPMALRSMTLAAGDSATLLFAEVAPERTAVPDGSTPRG